MKLYIRQKVFSWRDKFTVKDELGQDRYFAEGELFTWGKKLHVLDCSGAERAYISQKVWSLKPRFFVTVDGRQMAEIVKEFTFLRPRYSIIGPGWDVEGSFWAHNYFITRNGQTVVTIRKQWMTWGDCYELDIADPGDEIMAMAVVLTIDCVMADEGAAAAAAN